MEPFLIGKSSQMNTSCKYSFLRDISSSKKALFQLRWNLKDTYLYECIIFSFTEEISVESRMSTIFLAILFNSFINSFIFHIYFWWCHSCKLNLFRKMWVQGKREVGEFQREHRFLSPEWKKARQQRPVNEKRVPWRTWAWRTSLLIYVNETKPRLKQLRIKW